MPFFGKIRWWLALNLSKCQFPDFLLILSFFLSFPFDSKVPEDDTDGETSQVEDPDKCTGNFLQRLETWIALLVNVSRLLKLKFNGG